MCLSCTRAHKHNIILFLFSLVNLTHTQIPIHPLTHPHTHTHTHTHTYIYIHAHTPTNNKKYIYKHTYTPTHTHTHLLHTVRRWLKQQWCLANISCPSLSR